jgi:phage tail-like protein
VLWTLDRAAAAGEGFEFKVHCLVAPTGRDLELECAALLIERPADSREPAVLAARSVSIAVAAKGRYLQHLPAIYQESDEFMGRFLMLFESFWAPIVERIDVLPHYFDARTVPPDLLPWLASWVNLVLDERWPEAKRRRLLQSAVSLYRRRGTKAGLQDYLEIYSDVRPRILEQGGQNFRLGPGARLGRDMALGTTNQPHTFQVVLPLPAAVAADPRQAEEQRRIIAAIIAAEKPAHTAYTLDMPTDSAPAKP